MTANVIGARSSTISSVRKQYSQLNADEVTHVALIMRSAGFDLINAGSATRTWIYPRLYTLRDPSPE